MMKQQNISTNQIITMIENGVNINTLDSNGKHALDIAVENGHAEIMRVLIAAGASRRARNQNYHYFYQYATKNLRHTWTVSRENKKRKCMTCGRFDTSRANNNVTKTIRDEEIVLQNKIVALLFSIKRRQFLLQYDVNFVLITNVASYLYPDSLRCAVPMPRCDVPIDRVCRVVDPLTLVTIFQCLLLDRKIVLMSHYAWKLTDTFETVQSLMFPFRVKYSYAIYEPLVPLSENLKEILQNPFSFCLGATKDHLIRDKIMEEQELLSSVLKHKIQVVKKSMRKMRPDDYVDDNDEKEKSTFLFNKRIRAVLNESPLYRRLSGRVKHFRQRRRRSTVRLQSYDVEDNLDSVIFIDLDAGSDIRIEDNGENTEQLFTQIQSLVSDRIGLKYPDGDKNVPCGPYGALPPHMNKRLFRAFEVAYGWPCVFAAPDVMIEAQCEDEDEEETYELEQDHLRKQFSRDAVQRLMRNIPDVAKRVLVDETISTRLREIRRVRFYDMCPERTTMIRYAFLDLVIRLMLPFKSCLAARRNKLTSHKTRMKNLEHFQNTIEQERTLYLYKTVSAQQLFSIHFLPSRFTGTLQIHDLLNVNEFVKMSKFSTPLSKSFLRGICESQMFVQYTQYYVLYNERNVFDTFLAAHSLALEVSYFKYTNQRLGGHFGWLTLLPDARLVSYNSLMRRKRRQSNIEDNKNSSVMQFERGAYDSLRDKDLSFKFVSRDDVDKRVILLFQASKKRGGSRRKKNKKPSIVCTRYRAPTEEQCEMLYRRLSAFESPTTKPPSGPMTDGPYSKNHRRRSTIKSKWNILGNNSAFSMFSRIKFSGKRRRRSLFGMKHRQWQEYFFIIRGNPSGDAILNRAIDEVDSNMLLVFSSKHKNGKERLKMLRKNQDKEGKIPYLEWYSLPFEVNFLDEILERVTSQMSFYDHHKDQKRELKSVLMIFRERSAEAQVDENGHLICDYICETLDEEGYTVSVEIKWYQVIGVVRRRKKNDSTPQIERVIAHSTLVNGDVLEVSTDIVRSMGAKCAVVPSLSNENDGML